jgi:hypothetical protein
MTYLFSSITRLGWGNPLSYNLELSLGVLFQPCFLKNIHIGVFDFYQQNTIYRQTFPLIVYLSFREHRWRGVDALILLLLGL